MARDPDVERANLDAFVAARGGRLYATVPVSGPELGWSSGGPTHHVDAVWFETGELGQLFDWEPASHSEFVALLAAYAAVLVSPRGYADRTAFGMLIACRELMSRAYPDHQLLRAIALSDKMSRRSIAYLAEGIDVVRPDGTSPAPSGNRGPYLRPKPEQLSGEDQLVVRYYQETLGGAGTLWQEVPVSDAALDGLYVPSRVGPLEWWPGHGGTDLAEVVANCDVEVIEAKRTMNMDVIGQVVAGAIVLAHQYPAHRLIRQTVVVGGPADPCLDWVCHKRGIAVARFTND